MEWAGLSGNIEFAGSGSRGAAYRIGNKVLKITNDASEAAATNLIVGKFHPNVYRIYNVGKRSKRYLDASKFPGHKYVIICEFMIYPTIKMVEVFKHMKDVIYNDNESGSIFYRWDDNYINMVKLIADDLIGSVDLDQFVSNNSSGKATIKTLTDMLGHVSASRNEIEAFLQFWNLDFGNYGLFFKDRRAIENHLELLASGEEDQYMDGIASALTWLVFEGVVFSDLKTSNLMARSDQPVIIDLGYAKVLESSRLEEIQ